MSTSSSTAACSFIGLASPVYFVWGKIRDAWNAVQASQGKLGYPTADEQVLPDGSYKSTFEHGTVTWKTGDRGGHCHHELSGLRVHRSGGLKGTSTFACQYVASGSSRGRTQCRIGGKRRSVEW